MTRHVLYSTNVDSRGRQIDAVLGDFSGALSRATEIDTKVLNQALTVSDKYGDLVSLAVRQTIGGTELTISKGTDGGWNISDIKVFMKDVGTSR